MEEKNPKIVTEMLADLPVKPERFEKSIVSRLQTPLVNKSLNEFAKFLHAGLPKL